MLASKGDDTGVPLLVVRVRDLERTAWREGRAAARLLERRSLRSFVATASRALRASDVLAHDAESEDFLAAMISPMRSTGSVATPTDCRATLARVASAMDLGGSMCIETGWSILMPPLDRVGLVAAIDDALQRGARERERYAFFSTIGHELRTPLTSIRGYLETLLDEPLDAATQRRFLEVARSEAIRMGRLVDGMFEISMLDLRAGTRIAECSKLSESLAAVMDAVAPFATERGSSTVENAYADVDVAVTSDRLIQILLNVVENAIKHGRPGGRVVISVAPIDARYIELRVDDDGPGVPLGERESIFTLASRGSNASAKGWGIGLAIVRLMLERIGGEIDVIDSELGGACFRIRIPRQSEASAVASALASERPS